MLRIILVIFLGSLALCQESYNENIKDKEILIPIPVLLSNNLVREKRQLFGGVNRQFGGGYDMQAGFRGSMIGTPNSGLQGWGSLSQSIDRPGFSLPISAPPITFSSGLDLNSKRGHSLSLSGSHTPKFGSQATLAGNLNLLNTPNHNLNAFASHTKIFDTKFREIGRGSSTAGLDYTHRTGAGLSLSGTHTPGLPNSATLSGKIPLYNSKNGNTQIGLTGSSTFTNGQKPSHAVGLGITSNF